MTPLVQDMGIIIMGRGKKHGICRLCGKSTELTFEHIPPKLSYNRDTRYTVSPLGEVIEALGSIDDKTKSKEMQGGTGSWSLCHDCNEFLGKNYVTAYHYWVKCGLQVVKSEGQVFDYIVQRIEPLKIIKQIFSMFISMEDEHCYERHKELCEFVRNPMLNELSEKYQIHIYLNKEGNVVYIPPLVTGNFRTGTTILCSELTFIPYGYVLSIGYNNPIPRLANITGFKDYKLDEKVDITFHGINLLPNYLPFPLDYRTKEEIEITRQQSKKAQEE
jgi:hypothetical protein